MPEFNLAIIGAGPAGYTAALLGAQKGLKVSLIEKEFLGGCCLNLGCIPTKFFLHASSIWQEMKDAHYYGIQSSILELNYSYLKKRKDEVVSSLRSGIEFLLKKRRVDLKFARAKIVSDNEVLLIYENREESIKADKIIIASGSIPLELQGLEFDNKEIYSSDSILNLDCLPESLLIVGGGVIGVEFATFFAHFGSKVYLVEMMDRILPREDREISKTLEINLKKLGIDIYTSNKVRALSKENGKFNVGLENGENIVCSKILVAVSRRPNIKNLWQNIEIELKDGFIEVDKNMQTSRKNIYAIGDVKGGLMLAHSACYEAKVAISNILGQEKEADYSVVPMCIYTAPEIASVGLKEEEAKNKGLDIVTAKFPFTAVGKARAISKTEGFIKLIADSKQKVLIGAQLIGPSVTEFVSELSLAIKFKIPYHKLLDIVHPHPTLSEVIQEAIEILNGTPIHSI